MNDRSFAAAVPLYEPENGGGPQWERKEAAKRKNSVLAGDDPVADIATHATHLLRLLNEIKPGRVEQELGTKIQALESRLQNTEAKLLSREIELKKKDEAVQAAAAREQAIGKLVVRLSAECERLTAELYETSLIVARLETQARHGLDYRDLWKKSVSLLQEVRSKLKVVRNTPAANQPSKDSERAGSNE
jgi:hypothetical protein